jgi:ribonuclease G
MSDQSPPRASSSAADPAQRYDEELANPPVAGPAEDVDRIGLKAGAQERAKQRPLLQKILSVFQKEKTSFRELIINAEPLEKRVALLVDGVLEKFEIERESDNRMVGGIYKGRIKNLDPGLKAAFVDIGYSKNAFLHYWDMLPAAADSSVEVVRVNKKKNALPKGQEPTVKDIPRLYPPGRAPAPPPTSPFPAVTSCSCRTPTSAASRARSRIPRSANASGNWSMN